MQEIACENPGRTPSSSSAAQARVDRAAATLPLGRAVLASLALVALLSPTGGQTQSETASSCSMSETLEANLDFVLEDMHGEPVELSEFRGNVILLDFWATWCAPCRIEIPGFIEMLDAYENRGFTVLGVSVDDPPDLLREYAAELGMDYPVLIGDGRDDIKEEYGPLIGFPTSFIIDRDGTICHRHVGFAPKENFVREVEALL